MSRNTSIDTLDVTFHIDPSDAKRVIRHLMRGSQMFGVTNIKKDGSERRYLICPKAYRAEVQGTGKPLDPKMWPDLIRVPDMLADTAGGHKAHWRTLNLATIKSIRAQRRVFHVR